MITYEYNQNEFPYSRATLQHDYNVIGPEVAQNTIVDKLFDLLPHGSGIDYTWHITQHSTNRNKFTCINAYHAMNEDGFYCHTYEFKVVVTYRGEGQKEECPICKGEGYRTIESLQQYHPEKSLDELRHWLEANNPNIQWRDYSQAFNFMPVLPTSFVCMYCNGTGSLPLSSWKIDKLTFRGQKERQCCVYGLYDYIGELLNSTIETL